jgi:hypothetical protein
MSAELSSKHISKISAQNRGSSRQSGDTWQKSLYIYIAINIAILNGHFRAVFSLKVDRI